MHPILLTLKVKLVSIITRKWIYDLEISRKSLKWLKLIVRNKNELFYSLLVIFYSLLVTFYSLLVIFARYSLLFACHLLRFTCYSSLITFYLPLATNYFLFATFYYLLVTLYFHSSLLIRWSLHFTRCVCALISTIYLLNFRN